MSSDLDKPLFYVNTFHVGVAFNPLLSYKNILSLVARILFWSDFKKMSSISHILQQNFIDVSPDST